MLDKESGKKTYRGQQRGKMLTQSPLPPSSTAHNPLEYELRPQTNRKWSPNHARQATARIEGDRVRVFDIRNTQYRTATEYTTYYYDAVYRLSDVRTIDVINVPFRGLPSVAHLEISFGFADGRHLGVSVEARYEAGESYDPLGAFANQFELIYLIADERDMVRLGAEYNKNEVYLYRLKLTEQEVQTIFLDILNRANKLSNEAEFYHTIRNNCVSNIIDHINRARLGAIPKEYRTLFSGYFDHLLYDLNLIETTAPVFQQAQREALINPLIREFGNTGFFSAGIRQNLF